MNEFDEGCFGEGRKSRRKSDYFGLLSLGIFILVVGGLFIANPGIGTDFFQWIERMVNRGQFIRPSDGVIFGALVFFALIGISNFFKAVIRLWFKDSKRKAISDTLSGAGMVFFAYLIHLYSQYAFEWRILLALGIVIIGALIIVYSLISYWIRKTSV